MKGCESKNVGKDDVDAEASGKRSSEEEEKTGWEQYLGSPDDELTNIMIRLEN